MLETGYTFEGLSGIYCYFKRLKLKCENKQFSLSILSELCLSNTSIEFHDYY